MDATTKRVALKLLAERLCTSHCWRDHRHVNKAFTPVEINEHLSGAKYGLCPITPGGNTVQVAVLDLDSHKGEIPWEDMLSTAKQLCFTLEQCGLVPVLFKSSGGRGIHIYLLWDAPQDAFSVRRLLADALTACSLTNGTGGLIKHEVEIFPKQDHVPADGFGNMFVLPWTGQSEALEPFDAWPDSEPVPVLDKPEPKAPTPVPLTADLERLASALNAIPSGDPLYGNYPDWRNIVFAIHHETGGSAAGLALAHEFSARMPKYDPEFLDHEIWPAIRSDRDGAVITGRSLYAAASNAGWRDPALIDDFEVVESTTPMGEATPGKNRFEFISEQAFLARTPPTWIIKNVIPAAGLVVVYGAPGSGKTFLVLDMAAAIARGFEWRGQRTRQGRVAYIAAEGAGGLKNRLAAYKQHFDLASLDMVLLPAAPDFLDKAQVTEVAHALKRAGPVCAVFVDTLSRVIPGGDENSGEDMGRLVAYCQLVHDYTGATVVMVHHSGKDATKGARGWSGINGAADATIEVFRDGHDRVATVSKMKDGEDGHEYGFKLLPMPIGHDADGDVITSCVVEHCQVVGKAQRPSGKHQVELFEVVKEMQRLADPQPTVEEIKNGFFDRIGPVVPGTTDNRRLHFNRALTGLVERKLVDLTGGFVKIIGGKAGDLGGGLGTVGVGDPGWLG